VTFAKPVKVGEFPIVRYLQSWSTEAGEPNYYSWAIQVAISPEEVMRVFERRFGVEFARPWMFESWNVTGEAAKAGTISRNLAIEPYDDPDRQATLTCSLNSIEMEGATLPKALDLFGASELGPPPLTGGDKLMDTLLACRIDFFDALRAEKAAFGTVKMMPRNSSGEKGVRSAPAEIRIAFPSPVYVWGIGFTGYVQRADSIAGRLHWGFETQDDVDRLTRVIENRTGSTSPGGKGWIVNLTDEDWQFVGGPPDLLHGRDGVARPC
jgi:hypothetical protein